MKFGRIYILFVATCLGCVAPGMDSPNLSSSPLPKKSAFQAQLGIRVASPAYSSDLLPRAYDSVRSVSWSDRNDLSTLSLASAPSAHELGGIVKIETISSEPVRDVEISTFLSHYAPISFSESGVESANRRFDSQLSDTRFWHQLVDGFHASSQDMWKSDLRNILDSSPMRYSGGDDLALVAELGDPFSPERSFYAQNRADRLFRSALRDSVKHSDLGSRLIEELKNWREEPLRFALALLGGALEQQTPEGGTLSLGPDWSELQDSDSPAEILRARYVFGPFEARAELREAWVRCRTEWQGFTWFAKASQRYLEDDHKLLLGVQRRLDGTTVIRVIGGTGICGESLTGEIPFPEAPKRERTVGVIAYLERRF